MSFPRYPAYKDSGVEWLGEVPAHWTIAALRRRAMLNPIKGEIAHLARNIEVSFIPMEAVSERGELDLDRVRPIAEVESGYTYFREGDVSFAKITPCFENGKGARMRGLTNGVGFGTTELTVVRPIAERLDAGFLDWLFRSRQFRDRGEASMYGAGGQKRVPDEFVRQYTTAFPPVDEQRRIANLLDRETAKIDALVEEQQRLIELLKEKRQAVISQAVTKGLDPNVPMKDSGVEWLGAVPAHWSALRLKHVTTDIIDCPHETPSYDPDGEFAVIRTADISDGVINLENAYRLSSEEYGRRTRRGRLDPRDIVYSREGERWGHAALVPETPICCLGQRMMQFKPQEGMDAEFLMWALNSECVYRQGQVDTVGATSPHVNVETIRNFALARPPIAEQKMIADFISEAARNFDMLMDDTARALVLFQERRAALISAAVTGKIDVRGLAA